MLLGVEQRGVLATPQSACGELRTTHACKEARGAGGADLNLPRLQQRHAASEQRIRDQRTRTVAECREAERAAFQLEREQLDELGECPTLESLEAVEALAGGGPLCRTTIRSRSMRQRIRT
jgi:hypothetical protein